MAEAVRGRVNEVARPLYILDSNVLLQFPDVLTARRSAEVVVPPAVLDEIGTARMPAGREEFLTALARGIGRDFRIMPVPPEYRTRDLLTTMASRRLAGADVEIALLAIDQAQVRGARSVTVVTADRALSDFVREQGIRVITASQYLRESPAGESDPVAQEAVRRGRSKQWIYVLLNLVFGVVGSMLGSLAFQNYRLIIGTLPIWGTLVAVPVSGAALYWLREHYRMGYGVFEFMVGVMMTYNVLLPPFDFVHFTTATALQVLAGLYVMVRGLDNVGRGIEGTRAQYLWSRLFASERAAES